MHAARPIRSAGGRVVVMGASPHKTAWPIRDFHIPNRTLYGFIVTDQSESWASMQSKSGSGRCVALCGSR